MKPNFSRACCKKQMVTVHTAKSGLPYAVIGNHRIHSSYDPQKEARRFLDHEAAKSPGTIIILGPALGYLITESKNRFPHAKILTVFYSTFFYTYYSRNDRYQWHPESPDSLRTFFNYSISDFDIEGLTIFEWPPSAAAFPELSAQVHGTISQMIRERNGSLVATLNFGRRWLNNTIYNFLFTNRVEKLEKNNKPIVIAASGPSLYRGLELVRRYRKKLKLWALPSSLAALEYYNIKPDAVVVTDPGFYSTLHFRFVSYNPLPLLLMPLTACRGLVPRFSPVVLFSQFFFAEEILLRHGNCTVEKVPAYGTVAATAVELAIRSTEDAPVVVAGLDLCGKDLKTHVTPHAFDVLFHSSQTRKHTKRTVLFSRIYNNISAGTDSLPLKTYAGWFSHQKQRYNGRVFRLFPSTVSLDSMLPCNHEQFIDIINGHQPKREIKNHTSLSPSTVGIHLLSRDERLSIVKKTLRFWQELIREHRLSNRIPDSIECLMNNDMVFNLLYSISLSELIELKRDLRLYRKEQNAEVFCRMYRETEDFLGYLYERIENA